MTHWFRLADASATLRGVFPSGLAPIYHAVTLLGSPTLLLIVLAVAFWAINRRDAQFLLSLAFFAMGLVIVTKTWFALPRPPTDVALVAPSDSYGFPSGHAIAATVVYGGAVLTVDRFRTRWDSGRRCHRRRGRLSRVALGVHYLGDVITGIALGLLIVVAVTQLTHENAGPKFAGAVVVAVIASSKPERPTMSFWTWVGHSVDYSPSPPWVNRTFRTRWSNVSHSPSSASCSSAAATKSPTHSRLPFLGSGEHRTVCGILALPSVATLVQSRRQSSVKS